MAFVNKISSLFCSTAIKTPTGVWEKIIMAFNGGIQNYAWAIIVFTIVLKLIMLPLDFFNKKMSAKNAEVQAIVQPEVEKIQKKYGNNKQMINQKTMELYKKHNYNVTGSCVMMLVYMALTLFIFFTLFSGLNNMAAYKVGNQYEQMEATYDKYAYGITYNENKEIVEDLETSFEKYNKAYQATYKTIYDTAYQAAYSSAKATLMAEKGYANEDLLTEQDRAGLDSTAKSTALEAVAKEESILAMKNAGNIAIPGRTYEDVVAEINAEVVKTYNNVKESWLWIDNVWKSDVPWKKSSTSFKEYVSLAKITYKDSITEETQTFYKRPTAQKEADQAKYELVNSAIESESRVNGYLIIPILAVATNLLSMLASQGKLKFKRKKKEEVNAEEKPKKQPGGMIMVILLPVLMGYISISYNAVFALYILVSSIFGLATTPLINLGIKKWNEIAKKRKEKKAGNDLSYKR